MMRILAGMIVMGVLLQMMRGVESMGYKKADLSPLSGSPISDRPPPYCMQAEDGDDEAETLDSVYLAKPCAQNWQFYRYLQSLLSGTTANMSNDQNMLAGLLDVGGAASKKERGAATTLDEEYVPLAYVPPLDGIRYSRRYATNYWANYSMTFVPFDIELVSLKQVDPLGSSFTVQWKMLMQWEVLFTNQTFPKTTINKNCSFPCDTSKLNDMCCDNVWVPPLHIPQCNIDSIASMLDTTPPLYWSYHSNVINTYKRCAKKGAKCYHRRIWNLNIQTTCDTQMSFHYFPFDTQELSMDIYNPYSSRTWLQFVKHTLHNNGGNIMNQDPPLDENVPSWHIKRVVVSIKCGLPSWRQTFLTQNDLLKEFQSNYKSQESEIEDALNSLNCVDYYKNLEVAASADPSNFSVFDNMLADYKSRFANTWANYKKCLNGGDGTNYALSHDGPSQYLDDRDLLTLFGSWLNVNHSQNISFKCLIHATANLTTPIITITIRLQRYRSFYVVKLFLPAILCGVFTFVVAAMPPQDLKERLQVILSSTLALTALQITITAADVPAVSYMIPTSYLVIATYVIQVLVAMETVAIAKWHNRTNEYPDANKHEGRQSHKTRQRHFDNKSSKEGTHEMAKEGESLVAMGELEKVVEEGQSSIVMVAQRENVLRPLSWWKRCLTIGVQFKKTPTTASLYNIKRLDRALLFILAILYGSILSVCLFVPMYSGSKMGSTKTKGITIWSST